MTGISDLKPTSSLLARGHRPIFPRACSLASCDPSTLFRCVASSLLGATVKTVLRPRCLLFVHVERPQLVVSSPVHNQCTTMHLTSCTTQYPAMSHRTLETVSLVSPRCDSLEPMNNTIALLLIQQYSGLLKTITLVPSPRELVANMSTRRT